MSRYHGTMVAKFMVHNNRVLEKRRRQRQRERQKSGRFMLAKQQLCTLHFVTVVAQLLHLRVYALLVFLQGTFARLLTNSDLLLNPLTRIFIFL